VATAIVRAIDQDAAHAGAAHVAEGDLLTLHAGIDASREAESNRQLLAAVNASELLRVVGVEKSLSVSRVVASHSAALARTSELVAGRSGKAC
jgi:hypothetical protein